MGCTPYWLSLLPLCYAMNINIIKYKIRGVTAMGIALGNFMAIGLPALIILLFF